MDLLQQFQGFIGSIGFGFFFLMFFLAVYRFLNKINIFIKGPIFVLVFLLGTYLYFLFLVSYVYGIFNVFYPLSLLIGGMFYYLFFYDDFNKYYYYLIKKVRLKKDNVVAIIKQEMRKKYVKNRKIQKQIN